jgi:DNA modification methylase
VSIAYQSDKATLYHADALDALVEIPRKSVGLLATDPPYGVKWQSGLGKNFDILTGDDGSLDVPAILGVYVRHALMEARHVYVFGYSPDRLATPLCLGGTATLIWDKGQVGPGDLSAPWGPQHEVITFGGYYQSKANRSKGYGQLSARLRSGSVIRVTRKNSREVNRHPTEKPVGLMRILIESSSHIGDTVLDPFAGSGSTLVAAVLSGRKAVGVEIDRQYIDVAIERLKLAETLATQMEAA